MVDYIGALKYPFSNIKSFVIGAVLYLLSIFLLPYIFINGYIVRVIQETNKKSDFMPDWENWKSIAINGFFVLAIQIAYILPSMLIYTLATLTTTQNITTAIASNAISEIGIFAISLILISFLALLAATILLPVAIINYALTNDFKKAFDIIGITKTILISPLQYIINLMIGTTIFLLFLALAPFTFFISSALLFYPTIFFYRIIAEWFTELP